MDVRELLNSRDRIVFSATLPLAMRPEVESLFFFNPRQSLLDERIHAAIEQAGMPKLAQSDERVWIDVSPGKTQCLFACDRSIEPLRTIGVVLYSRPIIDAIWITHAAIDPDYTHGGENARLEVAIRLVGRVAAVARSIKGVTRIQLSYRGGCFLRVRRPRFARSEQPGG